MFEFSDRLSQLYYIQLGCKNRDFANNEEAKAVMGGKVLSKIKCHLRVAGYLEFGNSPYFPG